MDPFSAKTAGKGRIEVCSVFPGVQASYLTFLAQEVAFHHAPEKAVLELFYCRNGRVGWNMQGGTAIYLGAGDLAVHSAACCADSAMMFPLGYVEGVTISVDLSILAAHSPESLQDVDFQTMRAVFCDGEPAAIPACPELEGIFSPLYTASAARLHAYLQLKVQELLLYLVDRPSDWKVPAQYDSRQTELVKQIQAQLTQHLDRRFTIEELSKQYLINTSTLKAVFKSVYGLPIATYMKEYRIRQAMKLLRETDATIAEIASRVGYETQGKFSNVFHDIAQMRPTEYRKRYREQLKQKSPSPKA